MRGRVLVTGASGFVGIPLADVLLARGMEVHGASRRLDVARTLQPNVIWHEANILNASDRSRIMAQIAPDILVHGAWETEHGAYWAAASNLDWVAASLDLVRRFERHGGRRLMVIGTCMEYDISDHSLCHAYDTPTGPHHLYGTAKDALRRILERHVAGTGTSFVWPRLFLLFGAHEHPARLVPSTILKLARRQEAQTSSGRQRRDFMDSRTLAAVLVLVLESTYEGRINVASGQDHTIAELVTMIGEIMHRPDLVRIGALPDRPGEPPRLVADVAPLRALGYDLGTFDLRKCLIEYARHLTSDGPLERRSA